jgi:uncharacterized membrane protein
MAGQQSTINHHTVQCQICKKSKRLSAVVPAALVHLSTVEVIMKEYPNWAQDGFICLPDLNHFRGRYFEELISTDKGELSVLESEVLKSLKEEEELIATNVNVEFDRQLTLGERVADRVAEFGGSWSFLFVFAAVMTGWIVLNSTALLATPVDPYPYILLNLALSCLAAIQAPVIMMSQHRQETRDRLRGEHDYRVNLKAEIEIRHIIAKLDRLVSHQWQRLLEIQRLQLELLEEREQKPPRRVDG